MPTESTTIDVTPNPRILAMLGEIAFEEWQCIAEFVDNGIDSYLTAIRNDEDYLERMGLSNFSINVNLPRQSEFDSGVAKLAVQDTGPGMDLDDVTNAVRAGFSGNDPLGKLGLFGMGFNIASARLGRKTRVMTTKRGSPNWLIIDIDLDEMQRTGEFSAPVSYEPKDDDDIHGTIVEVSRLKPDFKSGLSYGAGRLKIRKKMQRIYSNILLEHPVVLQVAEYEVLPWSHCCWDETRMVTLGSGVEQSAIVNIDYTLPENMFCKTCWHWLEPSSVRENTCHMCGTVGNLQTRERRIRGWLGIQRYFDQDHYGIDFIRNGRVIESLNKDCFYWLNQEGELELEYPIDTTHWGGRIVGQINIDFAKVFYQKDAFEKNRREWKEVLDYLRGSSPLRPRVAEREGLPENSSPLNLLFKAFRSGKNSGRRMLVPGQVGRPTTGDNSDATAWAQRYWEGDPDFQSDEKWWERVILAERSRRGDDEEDEIEEVDPQDPFDEDDDEHQEEGTHTVYHIPDTELSQTYEFPDTRNAPRAIVVDVYVDTRELRQRDLMGMAPLEIDASGAPHNYKMYYHANHPAFTEFAEGPGDYVLMEVASMFSTRQGGGEWTVGKVYQGLKSQYQRSRRLDLRSLGENASVLLGELKEHLGECGLTMDRNDAGEDLIRELTADVMGTSGNVSEVERFLANGSWIERVSDEYMIPLIKENPSIIFDGRFFTISYEDIGIAEIQSDTLERVISCLRDAILIKNTAARQSPPDKSLLLRADAALSYLSERRE